MFESIFFFLQCGNFFRGRVGCVKRVLIKHGMIKLNVFMLLMNCLKPYVKYDIIEITKENVLEILLANSISFLTTAHI